MSTPSVLGWVIVGLVICVLLLVLWVIRLQRWSRVYRDVIEVHTRALSEQGGDLNSLRTDLLEANIRLDRLDPQ